MEQARNGAVRPKLKPACKPNDLPFGSDRHAESDANRNRLTVVVNEAPKSLTDSAGVASMFWNFLHGVDRTSYLYLILKSTVCSYAVRVHRLARLDSSPTAFDAAGRGRLIVSVNSRCQPPSRVFLAVWFVCP